jgi:hypothetical protein
MIKNILLSVFLFSFAFQMGGSVIEYSTSVSNVPINFSSGFTVPKFDSALGVLNKIEFILTGGFTGASRTENLSGRPVTVTLNNNVNFRQAVNNGGPVLFNEFVSKMDTFSAGPWDGSFPPDWTGASGMEFLYGSSVDQTFFLDKTDYASLSLFTGSGFVSMTVSAIDMSTTSISGSNIVASQFENDKSIQSTVRYHYSAVPEPKIYGLTAIGICGLVLVCRKRFRKQI